MNENYFFMVGALSHWIQKACGKISTSSNRFFLVDRQHNRNKVSIITKFKVFMVIGKTFIFLQILKGKTIY